MINKFLSISATGFLCCCILSKKTILRPRVQYGQYCTLLDQSCDSDKLGYVFVKLKVKTKIKTFDSYHL